MKFVEHKMTQVKAIDKTLSKVQVGNVKFASHEAISDRLSTLGSDNEGLEPPSLKASLLRDQGRTDDLLIPERGKARRRSNKNIDH